VGVLLEQHIRHYTNIKIYVPPQCMHTQTSTHRTLLKCRFVPSQSKKTSVILA
jgi:hypothetical protein